MTFEGMGEMFEGDSADTCASVDGGPSGGSRVRRPGSEDPHRRWRKFKKFQTATLNLRLVEIGQSVIG
jgi:hypothetical protein